jgi:DNA polymerase-3 subunit alpha
MAAVLTSELRNAEKLAFFLKECREMGIDVRPPDINVCSLRFSVDGDTIRFGLAAIKGVGAAAVQSILDARDTDGAFTDLLDFCERVDGVNRRLLESLIKAGAMDCFGLRRAQLFDMIDEALARAQQTQLDRKHGQGSLFEFMAPEADNPLSLTPPDLPEWEARELLSYEKELLGFYVSGHPIAEFEDLLRTYQLEDIAEVKELDDGSGTRTGGLITEVSIKRSKKDNRPWAILSLEGMEAGIECMVFADAYAEFGDLINPENVVFVEGTLSRRDEEDPKLLVDKIFSTDQAPMRFANEVHVRISEARADDDLLGKVKQICERNTGRTTLVLCLICASGEIVFLQANDTGITNTPEFKMALTDLLGPNSLREKADQTRPQGRERRRFRRFDQNNGSGND